ncbi:thioredoxin-like protein [Neocallimastix californiae]|uniref:Glutathione peroxidase n=1 Tax=Neocallimastix californiae TaxID=1754190 RepID=A0A1Y2BVF9_9FUNG|nr:thioredoxin-like protein [Neocallimastix californiae]|eukprot:ORY38736.1 thioredoxin-like protein [Neocallimastix californiae]
MGLEILDFPCNQFGHEAPGNDDEIHQFCTLKYNTTFDQFKKIDVNGENASPLYQYLKKQIQNDEINGTKNKLAMKGVEVLSTTCKKPGDIKWNFTKFLVDKEGKRENNQKSNKESSSSSTSMYIKNNEYTSLNDYENSKFSNDSDD